VSHAAVKEEKEPADENEKELSLVVETLYLQVHELEELFLLHDANVKRPNTVIKATGNSFFIRL